MEEQYRNIAKAITGLVLGYCRYFFLAPMLILLAATFFILLINLGGEIPFMRYIYVNFLANLGVPQHITLDKDGIFALALVAWFALSLIFSVAGFVLKKAGFEIRVGLKKKLAFYACIITLSYAIIAIKSKPPADGDWTGIIVVYAFLYALTMFLGCAFLSVSWLAGKVEGAIYGLLDNGKLPLGMKSFTPAECRAACARAKDSLFRA